ncbi:MAG: DUF4127 family protein [Oscillospiraceae bacterium]|nr:DUF4127 family protein [Oscillospiraceae bacterium]
MFIKRFLPAFLCLPLIIAACLLAAALNSGSDPLPVSAFDGIRGDLDGDGTLTAYDLTLYLQYLSGATSLSGEALALADINGDGKADEADLQLLQEHLSGGDVSVRPRVAYIPLDNRPVNQERVIYLAQAMGIELLVPEEHLYRTALDNMAPNPDGSTLGNRAALLEWLREADKTCDAFVISLDQMLSGGLVGSRWLDNTDLTFEYEVIDEIARLCENNTVILFDTVMRLASTVDYQGLNLNDYNALRGYGKKARRQLTGSELTIENIIAGYRYDENGQTIPFPNGEEILSHYLISRERKLLLADYLLRSAGDKMEFLFIGVDDSSNGVSIQTNEIRYLNDLLGENGIVSGGIDELGLCCLARMGTLIYGSPKVHLTYYGPGKDLPSDEYDPDTFGVVMDTHLKLLNVTETEDTRNALQILILTKGSTRKDYQALLDQLRWNLNNNIPTALMDAVGNSQEFCTMLLHESNIPIGELIGYSGWHTGANTSGLALSIGIGRYIYLSSVPESTPAANEGFLKTMTFSYIKDISYKKFHLYIDGIQKEDYSCSVPLILRRLNASRIVTSLSPYGKSKHGEVTVSNFRYPWNRTFEMTFDIEIG